MEKNKSTRFKKENLFIFLTTSFFVILLDQLIKFWVKNLESPGFFIVPNILKITYFKNEGIAFGVKINEVFLYSLIILFLFVIIFFYLSKILCQEKRRSKKNVLIFLGMILGGAFSNLIDRFLGGFIKDVFEFYYFSNIASGLIFNLADIFIVVGTVLLIISFWRREKGFKDTNFQPLK